MNKWLEENRLFINDLNGLDNIDESKFKFTFRGGDSGFGDGPYASPIWVRPSTLIQDMYKDNDGYVWVQIVGHTNRKKPLLLDEKSNNMFNDDFDISPDTTKLYVIDTMPYYYIVEHIEKDSGKLVNREIVASKTEVDNKNEIVKKFDNAHSKLEEIRENYKETYDNIDEDKIKDIVSEGIDAKEAEKIINDIIYKMELLKEIGRAHV